MEMKIEGQKFLIQCKLLLLIIFYILVNLLTLSNSFAEASKDTKLLFLGNKNIAPVVYLDNSTPSGIAVDIVHALAKHIPQPIEIKAMDWSEAQAFVVRGEADALIQINQTEERKKIYDFSDTLLESQFSIFIRADKMGISGISSLRGLRVGVESGGLPQQVLEKTPHILLTIIPNFLEGFKLLNETTIDAVVVDYRVGSYVLAENKIRNIKVTGEPIAFSYSSIAVKKGNTKLLNAINNALQIIKADGTYQNIIDKWKPKEVVFRTREQITQMIYIATILISLILFLIAVIWMVTLKKELTKRKAAEVKLREQYSTLRSIIDSAHALIYSVDQRYRYTSFNKRHAIFMKTIYGAEINLGHSLLDYITVTEDREVTSGNLDRALAGELIEEEMYSGEDLLLRYYFQISHSPVKAETGEVIGVAVLAHDITERKRAETERARMNRTLQVLSGINQALIHITDEATLLNEVCRIAIDVGGYRMAWIGFAEQDEAKTLHPAAHAGLDSGYIESAKVSWGDNERGRGPGGTAIRTGQPCMVRNIPSDPTFAPWREEALRRGYKSIIALPLISEGRAFGALCIYSSETDAFDAKEVEILKELVDDLAFGITALHTRTERDLAEEALVHSEKEKTILNQIANIFLTIPDEAMYMEVLAVVLQVMNSKFGNFGYIGGNGDLVIPSLTRDIWNECQVPGKAIVFPSTSWGDSLWGRAIREKKSFSADGPFRTPEGHIHIDHFLAVPVVFGRETIGLISVANKEGGYTNEDTDMLEHIAGYISPILNARLQRDMQERKRKQAEEEREILQERLQRVEKMEALGLLAGGVAHDLNNALGILVGYSEYLYDELDEADPLREDARNILTGGEQAATIVQDLLTLARRGVQTKTVVNLNEIVTEYLKSPEFLKLTSFHPNTHIKTELEEELLKNIGSRVHLSKTLMNLVSNAVEAMASGGEIVIHTENRYLDRPVSGYDELLEGDYVVLTVSDEGEGITDGDMKRIFEPFYTKKVMGRSGTGLGLSVVWSTVKDHNGYIDVQSRRGQGTTFTLYFPITHEEMKDDKLTRVDEYMGRGEKILVVDDIKTQRDLASRILTRLNYQIETVASGEEAVEYLKINEADLIVLDMIMEPGIDGFETYRQISNIRSRQKAIIVSGFAETERVKMAQSLGAGAFVKKPYIRERIGLEVRKELDRIYS